MSDGHDEPGVSADDILSRLDVLLSPRERFKYVALLIVGLAAAGLLATLWMTEPEPLPARTQAAFGALVALNLSWSVLAAWVLTRRRPLHAGDAVVAARLAVAAALVSTVASVSIAVLRGAPGPTRAAALVGLLSLGAALVMLGRARRRRAALIERRRRLSAR